MSGAAFCLNATQIVPELKSCVRGCFSLSLWELRDSKEVQWCVVGCSLRACAAPFYCSGDTPEPLYESRQTLNAGDIFLSTNNLPLLQ